MLGVLLSCAMTGCVSVQWTDSDGNLRGLGFLHYQVIETERALVYEHETVGLNLRITSFDSGVTLGYSKYIAVQPCARSGCPGGNTSGFLWSRDDISKKAELFFSKALGAEVAVSPAANRFVVGAYRRTIVLGPRIGESARIKIDFQEDDLHAIRFIKEE